MDAAVLGDRLPEGTRKPLLGPGNPSLQCQHLESSKVLAGLAFCEMPKQYPRSDFQGLLGVTRGGQQQFATQTLRVHLLGIEKFAGKFEEKIHKSSLQSGQSKELDFGLGRECN